MLSPPLIASSAFLQTNSLCGASTLHNVPATFEVTRSMSEVVNESSEESIRPNINSTLPLEPQHGDEKAADKKLEPAQPARVRKGRRSKKGKRAPVDGRGNDNKGRKGGRRNRGGGGNKGRGGGGGGPTGGAKYSRKTEDLVVQELGDDFSVTSTGGSRKAQNLNHLLNFSYSRSHKQKNRNTRSSRGRKHYHQPYRKEIFVQANYHFVLAEDGTDHSQSLHDPDCTVSWEAVQLVRLPIDKPVNCPICLSPPVAPKITKCGHIFCFTCILRYLSMGDRSWKRCPLCFEAVYTRALKSFEFVVHPKYDVGDVVDLSLLKRYKTSIFPFPHRAGTELIARAVMNGQPDADPNDMVSPYARVTFTKDIANILERERAELTDVLADPDFDKDSKPYIDMALQEIEQRQRRWVLSGPHPSPAGSPPPASPAPTPTNSASPETTTVPRSGDWVDVQDVLSEPPVMSGTASGDHSAARKEKTSVLSGDAFDDSDDELEAQNPVLKALKAAAVGRSSSVHGKIYVRSAKDTSALRVLADAMNAPKHAEENNDNHESRGIHTLSALSPVERKGVKVPAEPSVATGPSPAPLHHNVDSKDAKEQSAPDNSDNMYFFYQAADGQQLYLHSLNYRCLQYEFGSAHLFPASISAPILEVERFVQDQFSRRKFRFLSHIPLTSSFSMVELDLSKVLSDATIARFANELHQRAARREQRKQQALRDAKKLRRAQSLGIGSSGRRRNAPYSVKAPSHEDILSFPVLGGGNGSPGSDSPPSGSASPVLMRSATGPARSPSQPATTNWNKVALHGFATTDHWAQLPSPSLSPDPSVSATAQHVPSLHIGPPVASEMHASAWLPVSPAQNNGSSPPQRSLSGAARQKGRKGGRKSRKGAKRSIFSTASRRSYQH